MSNRAERRGTNGLLAEFAGPQGSYRDIALGVNPWQTATQNRAWYINYLETLVQLASNRFRWIGLPDSVDSAYLELLLVTQGCAAISFPAKFPGGFMAGHMAMHGKGNVYLRAVKWTQTQPNGSVWQADISQGVPVYENRTRYPIMRMLEIYAQELTDIRLTKQVNRYHQRIPMILAADSDSELDAFNTAKQIGGGEPMILVRKQGWGMKYEALTDKPAPYIGAELTEDERAVWAQVYDLLGIPNVIYKKERQITDEVRAQNEQTSLLRMSALAERRLAADELNRRFYEPNALYPKLLDEPISVVYMEDYESVDWNTAHTLDYEGGEQDAI